MGTHVRDVMTENPRALKASNSIMEAARLMRDDQVGSLPVVEDGQLVGMITDRDVVTRAVAEGAAPETTVGNVYSPQPVSIGPDADLDEALQLMARHQVRRLPIVADERLVGILAQADVARDENAKKTGELVGEISEPSEAERR